MDVSLTYRPTKYTAAEIEAFKNHRAKNGPDYRLCQNNRRFPTKNRAMRKTIVGFAISDSSYESGQVFLLFNVEYGWHSKPQTDGGHIEIVKTELIEINDAEPSTQEKIKFRDSFKDCEEFKRNLIEADYYKYG